MRWVKTCVTRSGISSTHGGTFPKWPYACVYACCITPCVLETFGLEVSNFTLCTLSPKQPNNNGGFLPTNWGKPSSFAKAGHRVRTERVLSLTVLTQSSCTTVEGACRRAKCRGEHCPDGNTMFRQQDKYIVKTKQGRVLFLRGLFTSGAHVHAVDASHASTTTTKVKQIISHPQPNNRPTHPHEHMQLAGDDQADER